jgi:enoyl-CoA hydratase/carnithine racemase
VAALEQGGRLQSEAAFDVGLVSAIADDVLAEALRIANVIASRGPIATRFGKEAIWRGLELSLEQGLKMETDLTILLQSTKDRAEGVRAFIEKRAPVFTGD